MYRKKREPGAGRVPAMVRCVARLSDAELQNLVGIGLDHVHAAGDAGIEGMHGAQDLDRTLGIGDGAADERLFTGLTAPAAQRGPRFQVEGTTSWKLSNFLS